MELKATPNTLCSKSAMEYQGEEGSEKLFFALGILQKVHTMYSEWQVTQYDCCFNNLAPSGCTQYFYGSNTAAVKVILPEMTSNNTELCS